MKRSFTFFSSFLFVFLSFQISLQALQPTENTTTFWHLQEVNKEWHKQQDIDQALFFQQSIFKNDLDRIQLHLQLVEQTLRQRSTDHLTVTQKERRNHFLNVLHQYSERKLFPTNTYHKHRQPYFVDNYGIHCAVGYLLKVDGQQALIQQIRKENNYAYIQELMCYEALPKWAAANGFTLGELAWIQPGYSAPIHEFKGVGNNGGVSGEIHVMKVNPDSTMLYMAGDFTAIDGVSANSIIGWDGTNWTTLGNGVVGEIHDIEWLRDSIIVVGNFQLNGVDCNIAIWNGSTWHSLQTGDINGTIFSVKVFQNNIYIGGDFQQVNGDTSMRYLAYLPVYPNIYTTNWTNEGGPFPYQPNFFAVNAPVKSMAIAAGQLLVGGDFTETAPTLTGNPSNFTTTYLAYWNGYDWTQGLNGQQINPVHTILVHKNILYVGGKILESPFVTPSSYSLSVLAAGFWYYPSLIAPMGDSTIHEFTVIQDKIYGIGDLTAGGFSYGVGMFSLNNSFSAEGVIASIASPSGRGIRAIAYFQDEVYVSGDFLSINGYNLNDLASSKLDAVSSTEKLDANKNFKVFQANQQLNIQYENLNKESEFYLFNAQGQAIKQFILPTGNQQLQQNTNDLAAGVYFYQIRNGNKKETGKIVIF